MRIRRGRGEEPGIDPGLINELETSWAKMGQDDEAGKLATLLVAAQNELRRHHKFTPYYLGLAAVAGIGLGILGIMAYGPQPTPAEQTIQGRGLEDIPNDAETFQSAAQNGETPVAVWCDLPSNSQSHGTLHVDPVVGGALGKAVLYPQYSDCPAGADDYMIPSAAALAPFGLKPMSGGH